MPRITRVYTRQGDQGTTRLGGGQVVPKDSLRIETFGTVDELNSVLGVVVAAGVHQDLVPELRRIQNDLFNVGSDLCILEEDKERMPVPTVEPRHVKALETLMDRLQEDLSPLENFILPGGTAASAHLHVARTVCRRAERLLVALGREEAVGEETLRYLNRLSDTLFVMARWDNHRHAEPDVLWDSRA
jgi:cob(I)alamin adenosyltransferase